MVKRANTQDSLTLAFELLKRIPKSCRVTAGELHQQLLDVGIERDIRSIQRNLEMLCEHFPIMRDERNKPYGYSWDKNSNGFIPQALTAKEAVLLSLANEYLVNLLPANLTSSFSSFFQEAKYQLNPTTNNHKERDWLKKVRVVSESQPLLAPKIDSVIFSQISEALYHNRLLNIEYHNSQQQHKLATVMPLGIAQQGVRLYLVCRFEGYDNERSLAIHRITQAKMTTFTFSRPNDFKLSQYDADGRFGFGEGDKCELQFCIDKSAGFHLLETPLSPDQGVQEHQDHYHITATLIQSQQLQRWLRGFGEQVWNVRMDDI